MTQQTTFFDASAAPNGQQSFDSSPADPTANPLKPRLFYYDGQLFEDPGPAYKPEEVLNFLSATYPELARGSYTSRIMPDGTEEITFHKVTGEKGAPAAAQPPASTLTLFPDDTAWRDRTILGMGGYAVVYGFNDAALKVGRIAPQEADYQRHFAAQGLALPVLAYTPDLDLPAAISREICPVHGVRQEILPPNHAPCSCDTPQAALLMPVTDADARIEPDDLRAFMMGFSRDAEQAGLFWDVRPANVARYRGRLVAIDFGEPS
jgi:PRTRC genetic system protein C